MQINDFNIDQSIHASINEKDAELARFLLKRYPSHCEEHLNKLREIAVTI